MTKSSRCCRVLLRRGASAPAPSLLRFRGSPRCRRLQARQNRSAEIDRRAVWASARSRRRARCAALESVSSTSSFRSHLDELAKDDVVAYFSSAPPARDKLPAALRAASTSGGQPAGCLVRCRSSPPRILRPAPWSSGPWSERFGRKFRTVFATGSEASRGENVERARAGRQSLAEGAREASAGGSRRPLRGSHPLLLGRRRWRLANSVRLAIRGDGRACSPRCDISCFRIRCRDKADRCAQRW